VLRRLAGSLYLQVLVAIAIGVVVGHVRPAWGVALEPLGALFVRLVKMVVAPIVFCTVVAGIAGMGDLKKVGRIGIKALVYFEVVTTIALAIGLAVVHLVHPGRGVGAIPTGPAPELASRPHASFLEAIVPDSVVGAFARGDVLPVLLFSVLFALSVAGMGDTGKKIGSGVEMIGKALFGMVGIVMRFAPLGAMGAMAFTVGKYGIGTLASLGKLMGAFYVTAALFVIVVLGAVARWSGMSIFRFIRYIREEIVIVLGTSSSESALPRLMDKLEAMGCSRAVVGMVVPTGYSFNLDGTAIYLTMAAIFVAEATGTELTLGDELSLLGVLLVTSKGAAAVTGGGFVTLAATLASTGKIPLAGLTLLLGVDRFLSEARAITNLIGNGVATVFISRVEGELDDEALKRAMAGTREDV
jgi:aerobic C4-dicarboxylate transport protein